VNKIYYKLRIEIDENKWNEAIDNASNGSIYAYSFYLDQMTAHWDALVLNDYEAVMPLPWKKKLGICYLYHPFLVPKLGVIGNNVAQTVFEKFLLCIPKKFSFWDINLNEENIFEIPALSLQRKIVYKISLTQPYQNIAERYNQNVKRNIRKARANSCIYKEEVSVNEVFTPAIKQFRQYAKFSSRDARNFRKLLEKLIQQNNAKAIGVYIGEGLVAGGIFLFDKKAAYYILATTSSEGKRTGASHYLIDQFIKHNASKISLLDFAGSDVPSVGSFYKSFGAQMYFYGSLRQNRLPPLIRWIKK
jgi:hypothetical protein